MCEKCQVYLYDYFQQPLDKENPLLPFVNQNQIKRYVHHHVKLTHFILTNSTLQFHKFLDAQSRAENYTSFVKKSENFYQQYDLIYAFLKADQTFSEEMKQLRSVLLDLEFLKFQRTDKSLQLLDRWIAFLIGSLFKDMFILHNQHTGNKIWPIDLDKGHPGRPDTAKKTPVKSVKKVIIKIDDDDDLYS